ncbi:MAG TPA: hypothetical protein VGK22_21300 [Candidatus Angelobacter sp.]|jgi:hypothetical protein
MKQYDAADELTPDQVIDRIRPVRNLESANELYSFGFSLLDETRERISRIESKATSMMVWSMALVAFIFSRVDGGKIVFHSTALVPSIIAVVSAALAAACIVSSWMAIRVVYGPVMGDEQWLPEEDINNPEELKLYHARVVHLANSHLKKAASLKGIWLRRTQKLLATSGVLLAIGIMLYCLFFSIHPLPHL